MSSFISLMDALNDDQPLTPIKDELASMKTEVKEYMDSGLSTDEMKNVKVYHDAILVAQDVVDKFLNK